MVSLTFSLCHFPVCMSGKDLSLFVQHSSVSASLPPDRNCVSTLHNTILYAGTFKEDVSECRLSVDGHMERRACGNHLSLIGRLCYSHGVVYAYRNHRYKAVPLDTLVTSTSQGPAIRGVKFQNNFILDGRCYLVLAIHVQHGPTDKTMTVYREIEDDTGGWMEVECTTPVLYDTRLTLPMVGGRAYGVSADGRVVSFNPRDGWVYEECTLPYWSPDGYKQTCLIQLGHYILITQRYTDTHHNTVYHWSAYDTISGEMYGLGNESFGVRLGMFTPAQAVPSPPNHLHYIDPALVYPHHGMRWGIIPPESVVVPDEG
ncbi:hypothetical protein KIPB_012753 [Kipferlia bialata]|uniref:Uncharacterized protein n=1 Tax=Kipferlia bialata TaxID=797122 RepID=A0A391P0E7_9EUKA|nr:hypothetical protein KIPB_012753 [Kipferlia bialata]|eukprot:g12753.t1